MFRHSTATLSRFNRLFYTLYIYTLKLPLKPTRYNTLVTANLVGIPSHGFCPHLMHAIIAQIPLSVIGRPFTMILSETSGLLIGSHHTY